MPGPRLLILLGLLGCYVVGDVHAIAVWRSEPALWAHAARVTPTKPRPLINHAKQLFVDGRDADVAALVQRADALLQRRGRR